MSAAAAAPTLAGHAGREALPVRAADAALVLLNIEALIAAAASSSSGPDGERARAALANVERLRRAWREEKGGVILRVGGGIVAVDDGEGEREIDGGKAPSSSSCLVDVAASAFIATNLDYVLRRLRRRGRQGERGEGGSGTSSHPPSFPSFVIAGWGAETCVESTVRDGADKGYIITYATDATLGGSPGAEARAQYNLKGFARLRSTAQILNELSSSSSSSSNGNGGGPDAAIDPSLPQRRNKVALLVIDVQHYCAAVGAGGMHDAAHARDTNGNGSSSGGDYSFARRISKTMVPNISRLLRRCRALGHEVLFTTIEALSDDGRDRSLDYKLSAIDVPKGHRHGRVLDGIAPVGDEICLPKTSASVFMSTTLDYVLRNLGVETLVVCGMISNQCVESSARDAADLGYDVVMVADATTAHTEADQAAAEETLRRIGQVIDTTDAALTSPTSPLAPPADAKLLRVAVLRTEDTGAYGHAIIPAFQELFRSAAASLAPASAGGGGGGGGRSPPSSSSSSSRLVVELHDHDVKRGEYPGDWDAFHGFLIPGSMSSAYDDDAWIQELKQRIRDLHAKEKRVAAVCFGHQVVAESLGGKVIKNPQGFTYGRRVFTAEQSSSSSSYSMYYFHNDIVVELPPGARLLGVDDRCPNHGMAIGSHILTVQGHPEFAPHIAPTGHRALQSILAKRGLEGTEWGRGQPTDSLLWATRMLEMFVK